MNTKGMRTCLPRFGMLTEHGTGTTGTVIGILARLVVLACQVLSLLGEFPRPTLLVPHG